MENLPSARALAWPVLTAVRDLGGSATIPEITERVAKSQALSDEQQAIPRGQGRTELEYRLAWARTRLKLVGLLDNAGSKAGVWFVTDLGHTINDPEMVETLYKQHRAARRTDQSQQDEQLDEADLDQGADEDPVDGWRDHLLKVLKSMPPDAFERLAQRLMREAGFLNVTVTGKTGDGGLDGVGTFRNGLVSWTVFFQCKRYKNSVGSADVRDFRGAMSGRGEKGLLITTGTFTASAKAEASRDGAPSVDLVDGERLCDLLRDYNLGVHSVPRTEYDISIEPGFFAAV